MKMGALMTKVMVGKDFMILVFCMGPAAGGSGLFDIDEVLFRVTKITCQKMGSPCATKIYR